MSAPPMPGMAAMARFMSICGSAVKLKQAFHTIHGFDPRARGFTNSPMPLADFVRGAKIEDGLLTCFIRHTSASLLIQENADPDVQKDLQDFFAHLATSGPRFRHTTEGPDDMPSHIRSALTQTSHRHSAAQGPAGAGHLAGDLCVRASRRAAPARSGAACDWGITFHCHGPQCGHPDASALAGPSPPLDARTRRA